MHGYRRATPPSQPDGPTLRQLCSAKMSVDGLNWTVEASLNVTYEFSYREFLDGRQSRRNSDINGHICY